MILHVDLDAFLIAVARRRAPELADRPVVIGGQPNTRGFVAAASREARRAGVRSGMRLSEASLRCADAIFIDGALDDYFAASLSVDDVLRREAAAVEWGSIDEAFVALPAWLDARASIDAVERIQAGIRALGFDAACGLARNKLVAGVASRLARPRGIVHVLDGYEARFLAPLKIDMLPDVDEALVERLRGAGVRRLGQIVAMADADLATLAGRLGPTLARSARGLDTAAVRRSPQPPARIVDRTLAAATADPLVVADVLGVEAERLGRELRARRVFARALTLRVTFADSTRDSATLALPEPSALDSAITTAALELASRLIAPERAVRAVGLSSSGGMAITGDEALLFPLRRTS